MFVCLRSNSGSEYEYDIVCIPFLHLRFSCTVNFKQPVKSLGLLLSNIFNDVLWLWVLLLDGCVHHISENILLKCLNSELVIVVFGQTFFGSNLVWKWKNLRSVLLNCNTHKHIQSIISCEETFNLWHLIHHYHAPMYLCTIIFYIWIMMPVTFCFSFLHLNWRGRMVILLNNASFAFVMVCSSYSLQ